MEKIDKFTLINKDRSRIKVFEAFEDVSNPSPSIDAMMISYGCVYKRSSKPVMKASRVETIEATRKEYKQLLEKDGRKQVSSKSISKGIFEDSRASPRAPFSSENENNKLRSLGYSQV